MNGDMPDLYSAFTDEEYAHAYMEEFLNASIATQIKVLREERDWSQKELAERAGMKQPRLSTMENVNYGSWSINTLRRLACAFDLRLKVSFETFSSGIYEIDNFGRSSLQRSSRIADLTLKRPSADSISDVSYISEWKKTNKPAKAEDLFFKEPQADIREQSKIATSAKDSQAEPVTTNGFIGIRQR